MKGKSSGYSWESPDETAATGYIFPAVEQWLAGIAQARQNGRSGDECGADGCRTAGLLLDAGCGNGAVLGRLKKSGWRLAGLEISESGLAEARRAHPELEIEAADLTDDLSGHRLWGQCDVVLSLEVVEHVFLPRRFARNCYGFLKPGGQLILSTPYHGYLKNLAMAASGKMDGHFTALWDYGHIKFWSRATLTELLEEAGFSVTGFAGVGRVPYLWKSMLLLAEKPLAG